MSVIIQQLLALRNQIFKVQRNSAVISFMNHQNKFISKDFGKLLMYSRKVEQDRRFGIFEVWNIKRKTGKNKDYDEVCLTDNELVLSSKGC
mmetsp:Transcript_13341/g.15472  ORF Transcript_13341/g.15472 Transcript_13341/m.15472 type:complete len:91 (-) Transcript_13341:102-374(-)